MTDLLNKWQTELNSVANPEKAEVFTHFFKTGEGEYGYGDRFIGVVVPANRAISKNYAQLPFDTIARMITHPIHEYRLGGFLALVARYRKDPDNTAAFYIANIPHANNWDLVDLSAPYILGEELRKGRHIETIRRMAKDDNLWVRRASVVSTLQPIRKHELIDLALEICDILISDPHPLMRKAVGWVLREIGKKDIATMRSFLSNHLSTISATTLSYAIERLSPQERTEWRTNRKSAQL